MIGNHTDEVHSAPVIFLTNELQLLQTFIQHVQIHDPDVFIGWNVINFDFRFLQNKADELKTPLTVGRNQSTPRWRQSHNDSSNYFLHIPGRVVLDGIDTLKKRNLAIPQFSSKQFHSNYLIAEN